MLTNEVAREIERIGRGIPVAPAVLKAVVEVESNGVVFAKVDGRNEPIIRFEGHYFDRLIVPAKRDAARKLGLASPTVGGVKNPASQEARWALLERAMKLDQQAALESVSWGVGQVMGSHWKVLGYSSVLDLVNEARNGVAGQVSLMVRFIEKNNLLGALKRNDWAGFARGYNGPAYKKNAYDTKMAAAFERYSVSEIEPVNPAAGMLRLGSKGAGVREIQALLLRAGYAVTVDGDFGPATDRAVREYQGKSGLDIDGVVGPSTLNKLKELQISADEKPGALTLAQVPEVKDAAKSFGPLAFFTAARDQIAETATYIIGVNSETATAIANGLLAASGAMGLALTAYGLWGWYSSKKTVEQA